MKNNIVLRKITAFLVVFLMLCAAFIPTNISLLGNTAYAGVLPGTIITGARVTDINDNPISGPVGAWSAFRIHVDYELPDNTVKEGDTLTMTLPTGFAAAAPFEFEIKVDGNLVATGKIADENPAKVVITYTKYAAENNNVKGSFYFNTQINNATQNQTGVIPVTLTVVGDGTVVNAGNVTYTPHQVTPVELIKAGWMDNNDNTVGHFKINVNQSNGAMVNAKLVDTLLTQGVQYVAGSFKVFEGVWTITKNGTDIELINPVEVTNQFINNMTVGNGTFEMPIGNRPAGKGLQIRYDVKLSYNPVVGEQIENKAELTNNGQTVSDTRSYTIRDAGGNSQGQGYIYKIEIIKTGENGELLADAFFDVIRVRNGQNVGHVVTGPDGKAEVNNLLLDEYNIVETDPPNGYKPLTAPVEVKESDFNANKVATKTIVNQKDTPQNQTSVSVQKIWDGEVGNPVTVQLKKEGSNTVIQEQELNVAGNWKYTFTNLPELDANGLPINYKVVEKDVPAGYTVSYSTDANTGTLIVKNTQQKIDVTVTKDWQGMTSANYPTVMVQLLKNGQPEGNPGELPLGQPTYTWTSLDRLDAQGKPYVYTVQEIGESGGTIQINGETYRVTYGGNGQTGLTITNTKMAAGTPIDPTVRDIRVIKFWKDADGKTIVPPVDKLTVELYKDGSPTGKTLELSSSNGWTGVFQNLEIAKTIGGIDFYNYTVKEVGEQGNSISFNGKAYKVSYEGNMNNGLIVTNTGGNGTVTPKPSDSDKDKPGTDKPGTDKPGTDKPGTDKPNTSNTGNRKLPKTGADFNMYLYVGLMLTSATMLSFVGKKHKKHVK